MTRLAYYLEPFADVARRLNLASRVIAAQEAIESGHAEEARAILFDLEHELVRATRENGELEEAA